MGCAFYACPEFWKDIKEAKKGASNRSLFETSFSPEEFELLDIDSRIDSIKILRTITTLIKNTFTEPEKSGATSNGTQPFIERGFTIYKLRFGIDNRGKSGGLRIMYCIGKEPIVIFICLKFKKEVANKEGEFQAETLVRLGAFLKDGKV